MPNVADSVLEPPKTRVATIWLGIAAGLAIAKQHDLSRVKPSCGGYGRSFSLLESDYFGLHHGIGIGVKGAITIFAIIRNFIGRDSTRIRVNRFSLELLALLFVAVAVFPNLDRTFNNPIITSVTESLANTLMVQLQLSASP